MRIYAREPEHHADIVALFARLKADVAAYNPDLVIVLGCDHFNGFFLNCMPSFCLGLTCEAVADVGGTPGPLAVTPAALAIAKDLREQGIDTAVSSQMKIDHGFSQTMSFVMEQLDSYPTLPIFVNSIAPPYVPFQRSRKLGEALAHSAQARGVERLLVIATGGMSHHPTRYYPDPAEAEPPVGHYQLHGPDPQGLSHAQWLERLEVMHLEGAQMLVDGRRTREDIHMNPELDKRFANILCQGELTELDGWDNEQLIAEGGVGFTELHTWVAATALYRTLNPQQRPVFELYAETLEYGIGYGAISGGF